MSRSSGSSRLGRCWALVGVAVAGVVVAAAGADAASAVWNVARVGAPVAGGDPLVAVVDSGVDAGHVAFGGRVIGQQDFVGDGERGDPNGHGTHVAGTIGGGSIDCGSGPASIGVAPASRVLSARVLDGKGRGTVADVAEGIRWAADRGAVVINLSLGPEIAIIGGGSTFVEALEYAWSKGAIPVVAAGNDGLLGDLFGSGYGDVPAVVVTATTRSDRKASYATSVGSARWGISAPGGDGSETADGDVLSAWPSARCGILAGTSMAAPHVSGALAVLRAKGLAPRQAVDRLLATAEPIGPASTYGAGLVDLDRAVEGLGGGSPAPVDPDPPPTDAEPDPPATRGDDTAPPSRTADDGQPASTSTTSTPSTTATSAEPAPSTTAAAGSDDEVATGLSTVRDEADRRPGGPLVAAAGLAVAAMWILAGRAALVLRA